MKIGVVSISTPEIDHWACITHNNKQTYCDKHNYTYIPYYNKFDSREATWNKIPAILKNIRMFDWILWCDADTMIMNYSKNIEDIIALTENNEFMLISKDCNGINAGVFLIKNCYESISFLEECYEQTEFLNVLHYEQSAITKLYNEKYSSKIKIIDQKLINSYDRYFPNCAQFSSGDFILHSPGTGVLGDYRYNLFRYLEDKVQNE